MDPDQTGAGGPRGRQGEPNPRLERALLASAVAAMLLLVWWANHLAGGSRSVLPHLFYLPIIVAAVRFGWPGALCAGLAAALLSGPALPADVASGEAQRAWTWIVRGTAFVLVGLAAAFLTRRGGRPVRSVVSDVRTAVALRDALRRERVDVHYQPILELAEGRIVAVEALARWRRPGRGEVPPAVFVGVAERTGLIGELDGYVLSRAVRDLRSWQAIRPDLTLSVNVSATRLGEPELLATMDEALAEAGVDPSRLQVEITETGVIADLHASAAQVAALRRRGVRVAIDDFGAGQTSLGHLHRLAVDTVKVDRRLVARAVSNPRAARLLAGLIRLLRSLGVEVVAEGVSSAEEYYLLLSLRCPAGQGFYLGRPMPSDDVTALLSEPEDLQSRPARQPSDRR